MAKANDNVSESGYSSTAQKVLVIGTNGAPGGTTSVSGKIDATNDGVQLPDVPLSVGVYIKVEKDEDSVEVILDASTDGDIVEGGERVFYAVNNLNHITVKRTGAEDQEVRYAGM
jgi:hypothetical protein